MTEQQLLYFTSIVELGSYNEASLELNISQSSISKQIMQLEDELGVRLFDRSFRKAKLTEAGDYLYQYASNILSQMKQMKEIAETFTHANQKKLSLLTLPVISHYNFYIPISSFENVHPEFKVDLEEMEEPEMYRRITTGDFDGAIAYYNPAQIVSNMKFYPIVEDEMVLICPENNPLCRLDSVRPSDIDGIPLMAMQRYTYVNHFYELYFKKHLSNPRITFRGRPETLLSAVDAGKAPALITRIHSSMFRTANVKALSFDPPLKAKLGIIIKAEDAERPEILELVNTLRGTYL